MRAITHVAVQNYYPADRDCLIRRGNKYAFSQPPLMRPDDVPLPIQCAGGSVTLCFGDRIRRATDQALIDPLQTITWPVLQVGDTVLVNPRNGDYCLMNRQPTLVRHRPHRSMERARKKVCLVCEYASLLISASPRVVVPSRHFERIVVPYVGTRSDIEGITILFIHRDCLSMDRDAMVTRSTSIFLRVHAFFFVSSKECLFLTARGQRTASSIVSARTGGDGSERFACGDRGMAGGRPPHQKLIQDSIAVTFCFDPVRHINKRVLSARMGGHRVCRKFC